MTHMAAVCPVACGVFRALVVMVVSCHCGQWYKHQC